MVRSVSLVVLVLATWTSFGQALKSTKPKAPVDNDQAEMRLRMRLDIAPHDRQAHSQLIGLLEKRGAGRALVETEAAWLNNNPDEYDDEIMMRSWATASLDDPDFALKVDKVMLQRDNRADDAKGYDFLADRYAFALLDRGHNDDGIAQLTRSAQLAPDVDAVWANLANAYEQLGEYQKAIPYFRKALDLRNNSDMTHADFSKTLLQAGELEESETEIRVAIAMEKSDPTDEFDQMMKRVDKATKTDTMASGFHIQLAKVYTAEKKYSQAISEVDAAEQANSNDISLEYLKAEIWDAANDPTRAAAARHAAKSTIDAEFAKEAKARPSKDNPFDDATYVEEALFLNTDPHDPLPYDGSGEAIALLGPLEVAGKLKSMDKLVLGTAYCEKGNAVKCRRLSEDAMRDNPKFDRAKAHHNLADSLRKDGDQDDAASEYRTAYEMDPQNTTYRNDYEATRKH